MIRRAHSKESPLALASLLNSIALTRTRYGVHITLFLTCVYRVGTMDGVVDLLNETIDLMETALGKDRPELHFPLLQYDSVVICCSHHA